MGSEGKTKDVPRQSNFCTAGLHVCVYSEGLVIFLSHFLYLFVVSKLFTKKNKEYE